MHKNAIKKGNDVEKDVEEGYMPVYPVTILGVGNIILQDEGFGVHALKKLEETYTFQKDVQLLDGGTLGVELLPFLTGTKKLLIFDAVSGGKIPGTFYRFQDEKILTHYQDKLSVHDIGIQDVLNFMSITGKNIPTVVLLGVEPLTLKMGVGLSPLLESKLAPFLELALDELKKFDLNIQKRG